MTGVQHVGDPIAVSVTAELSPNATRIREADRPPVGCASCYGQYPQRRHVDFSASYEGPILGPQEGVVGAKLLSVDDLIICDECLTAAAKILGLGNVDEVRAERDEAVQELSERYAQIEDQENYITSLEKAIAQRKSLDEVNGSSKRVSKPRGR